MKTMVKKTQRSSADIDQDIKTQTKVCNKCGNRLDFTEFSVDNNAPDGKINTCKPCHKAIGNAWREADPERDAKYQRKRKLMREYGLTLEEWDEMYCKQEGKCSICGTSEKRLVVDHCHKTGNVRELLCDKCNMAIGLLQDDLNKALTYLRRY